MILKRYRGIACVAILLYAPMAEAEDAPGRPKLSAGDAFLLGNVVFALLHEFGHAIINDFDVPLLGLEENSADTIAAVTLVLLDREHPDAGLSMALGVTALVQAYTWDSGVEHDNSEVVLWAQHGLSAQRYARLVCLLYGSDPDRFGWVAKAAEMEDIRADGCEHEWSVAERAGNWLRDTYGVAAGENIDVAYGAALNKSEKALLELLQQRRILERLAQLAQARFAFPEPLSVRLSHCRVPNAYWDPEYREIMLCYELMTEFLKFADRPEVAPLIERFHASQPESVSSRGIASDLFVFQEIQNDP